MAQPLSRSTAFPQPTTGSAFTEDGGGDWKGKRIEVLVEVRRISAWREGKKLHIAVGAVVDGVEGEWTMTFYREGRTNAVRGYTYACVKAPGGREEDAKRIVALVKALTGEVPNINHVNNRIDVKYASQHLKALAKYAEVSDII